MIPRLKIALKYSVLLTFSIFLLASCSRKKDNFVSRSWHSIGTEYNILYNGNLALEQGLASLREQYVDNYWEILPIERMQVSEDIMFPGESKNESFGRAEEKAVKAVQRHSMNIKGKEENPQIDEAYLLLGKARYFDQRFVPALEAFNYILFKYPSSNQINQAKVWREKANIRMENDELAIENLTRLLEQEEIDKQDLADATSILAQAYINLKQIDSAIAKLEIAAQETKSNEERGRYRFIQGQLYNQLEHKDSANLAFDKVIELNRQTPRIYLINAYLEKAKNFDYEEGNKLEFLELLTDLEENRENRPFLDRIYHQKAVYFNNVGSDSTAIVYYNKSLRTNSRDKFLVAKNHQTLGNMSFDNAEYKTAGAYYDSTLVNLKKNTKLFRAIQRKRDNLADVIYYEDVAQRNDSILNLVNMPEEARLTFFNSHIEKLKAEDKARKEKEEIAEANKRVLGGKSNTNSIGGSKEGNDTFYFYNQTTVSFGRNEFIQTWGERQLEDNWRWSNKNTSSSSSAIVDEAIANASQEELYDPKFYLDKIPTAQTAIDSLAKDRNFAYYQLGLIYKDKFKENNLAKDKLQALLKNNPEERLVLPSKYNLYKIYVLLGDKDESEIMKNDIITNHPDSRYASILLNPDTDLGEDENSPEFIYEKLYKKFLDQDFASVIEESDKHITNFDGESIVPKFEFLKAVSKARLYGYESYKEAVNFIALNYPNSPEGKKAEEMMQNVMPSMANKEFIDNNDSDNFKVVYQFENDTQENIDAFKKQLEEAVKDVEYFKLSVSEDIYNNDTKFIVVHGLKSIDGARGFAEILKDNKDKKSKKPKIDREYFAISSQNYQIVQIHKNLNSYLEKE
jgi:tetratricopeptide (TPR) repeat protein